MSLVLNAARRALGSAAMIALCANLAAAGERLTGDQITAQIAGKTVTGAMESSGEYAEYYQADGMIKGKDYIGKWSVEGDSMCFQYGADPKSCWQVAVDGDRIEWLMDGKVAGTGIIVDGNPNNF
ncbi:MAG: hypothetical protein ACREEE_03100 [Dongiaceae bacterium]